eukprot:gnl/TRDRNA2_/TRDRNA2_187879_c0_seq1.p1 gnl/TRDRNA2_/TRDRNA2_187879_c0~~gnl/TRDRNA2_/TRDRNA2_187879_c0_seq1.p1  ORF type:complete len:625 (+),score=106.89 gnl/TRDRNA2_/TRDRNA2_187879_c0_seq1:63-1937(+)
MALVDAGLDSSLSLDRTQSAASLSGPDRDLLKNMPKHKRNSAINLRSFWGKLSTNPRFENSALCVIVFNAAWLGLDLDLNPAHRPESPLSPLFFEAGENIFCFIFTGEIVVRILSYKRRGRFFTDPLMWKWNNFDFALVGLMIVETWVLTYMMSMEFDMSMFSVLRLLRLLRISRAFRLVPELGIMVTSMVAAIRSVSSTACLLLGIMYVFAILLTQWTKSFGSEGICVDGICFEEYFGTLAKSFLALTQILVFDDTFELIRPIFDTSTIYGFVLIAYILLVSYTVLNMLIGVICDIVSDTTDKEKQKMMRARVEEMFEQMDLDESGAVSQEEFTSYGAVDALEKLGIDKNIMNSVFECIDTNEDGQISLREFVKMIFTLLNAPTSKELLQLNVRIDKVAQAAGISKSDVMALEKDRSRALNREATMSFAGAGMLSLKNGVVNGVGADDEARLQKEKSSTGNPAADKIIAAANQADSAFVNILKRFSRQLGDLQITYEAANSNTKVKHAELYAAYSSSSGGQGRKLTAAEAAGNKQAYTLLGPALRVLNFQLHALRAETKAGGLEQSGSALGGNRSHLQPLDELITEVIEVADSASVWSKVSAQQLASMSGNVNLRGLTDPYMS